MDHHEIVESEEYVDWRGREIQSSNYGGIKCAVIACVVEVLENLVFISNASNFVAYFSELMNYRPAEAANMVTNFFGTSFLLTIFGGFISDSFITRFWTFILFGLVELLGLILLLIQASTKSLQPAKGHKPSHAQEALLFAGLYAMATGVGGVKATLEAHGADQLDKKNKKLITSFFNWFFFALSTGGLLSSTFMVWVEQKSWRTSFRMDIGIFTLALCIFAGAFSFYRNKRPTGSPLTRIFKVLHYAVWNSKKGSSSSIMSQDRFDGRSRKLKFLDNAMINNEASWEQVEETRTFLGLLPILFSTIMMNCCLAQLTTFSVHQAMAIAALVEIKRRNAAEHGVKISVFWLGWQYLLLGFSDMLTLGGMLDFFYSEAPDSMRSMSTALAWCSTSLGFFLSSVLVAVVNSITGAYGHQWLGGTNLNKTRLDLFYALLCVLNFINFLIYLYCAKRY
ncbi:hypothetical protein ACHQM5_028114 [Ranunculus cassubicifolius]